MSRKSPKRHTSPLRTKSTMRTDPTAPETETMFMKPSEWLSTLKGETKEEKSSTTPSIPKIVELMNIVKK